MILSIRSYVHSRKTSLHLCDASHSLSDDQHYKYGNILAWNTHFFDIFRFEYGYLENFRRFLQGIIARCCSEQFWHPHSVILFNHCSIIAERCFQFIKHWCCRYPSSINQLMSIIQISEEPWIGLPREHWLFLSLHYSQKNKIWPLYIRTQIKQPNVYIAR